MRKTFSPADELASRARPRARCSSNRSLPSKSVNCTLSMDNDEINIKATGSSQEDRSEEEDALDGHLKKDIKTMIKKISRVVIKSACMGDASMKPDGHLEDMDSQIHSYSMHYKSIGNCIIINNENFFPRAGMAKRNGTQTDASRLSDCFHSLGFEVKYRKDLTCEEMRTFLKEASQENLKKCACLVCVVLSHGEDGVVYGTDGPMPLSDIAKPFSDSSCPSLVGKPRLVFIQACRGTLLDKGVDVVECDGNPNVKEASLLPTVDLMQPDFLFAFATVSGYFSWRNPAQGSCFIQSLCSELQEHGQRMELTKLLTRVNRRVATEFTSNTTDADFNNSKQIPCVVSMLTKELYLLK
ncbi:caspase-7-like [Lethenteron reissneri]|uniref:caspase-7-like n=1 Tax=Lethenteron reissneri TaxID=7753 RepID=UPI002AB74A09|nr:caspase-7-like [Lethenteron reissneri]